MFELRNLTDSVVINLYRAGVFVETGRAASQPAGSRTLAATLLSAPLMVGDLLVFTVYEPAKNASYPVTATVKQLFCGGSGTSADPYLICNAAQLDSVRHYLTSHFRLNNDIDIADGTFTLHATNGWEPIGTSGTPFTGTLHGGGHKITNLWISRSGTNYIGLFGLIQNARIDSLGVEISATGISGFDYIGGVLGYCSSSSTISNCYATGGRISGNS